MHPYKLCSRGKSPPPFLEIQFAIKSTLKYTQLDLFSSPTAGSFQAIDFPTMITNPGDDDDDDGNDDDEDDDGVIQVGNMVYIKLQQNRLNYSGHTTRTDSLTNTIATEQKVSF